MVIHNKNKYLTPAIA